MSDMMHATQQAPEHDAQRPVSASAERMRLSRQRRRDGLVFVTLLLEPSDTAKLTRYGLLPEDQRRESDAVADAVYGLLDRVG